MRKSSFGESLRAMRSEAGAPGVVRGVRKPAPKKKKPRHIALPAGPVFRPEAYESTIAKAPASVLAERERRAQIEPRSITAALLGDPLPGYSALDRRGR